MPSVQRHLMDGGAFFDNAFVATPVCCPSRTESFTGRYFHNVLANATQEQCMHAAATEFLFDPQASLFSLMEAAGYETGVFGKTVNSQGSQFWDPKKKASFHTTGMTYIDSPVEYNEYNGLQWFHKNGSEVYVETVDATDPIFGTTYQTTQLGNRTLRWLDQLHASGSTKPFMVYIGPHAPHFPAEPAPWYQHAHDHLAAPRIQNYVREVWVGCKRRRRRGLLCVGCCPSCA